MLRLFDLRTKDELKRDCPKRLEPCRAIAGLIVYARYKCLLGGGDCDDHCTRSLAYMKEHVRVKHGARPKLHDSRYRPMWRGCRLQTYFTAKGLIDYFVVKDDGHDQDEGGKNDNDNDDDDDDDDNDNDNDNNNEKGRSTGQPQTPARRRLAAAEEGEALLTLEQS